MLKDFSCASGDTTELNNILLHPTERLIRNVLFLCLVISVLSVYFKTMAIFQVIVFQRFISVFSVYFISIIFSIGFSYISALYRYHELIKHLVVHKLDIWSKFQSSGDALYMHFVDGDRDALFARMEAM